MSEIKKRLKPWLEEQIHSGQFPGVEWIDKKQKIFKLPWKHKKKYDWKESDFQIFKAWAINTGRFKEGKDSEEWGKWKLCLRNALHKHPYINELTCREEHLQGSDPHRVYQFLTEMDGEQPDFPVCEYSDDQLNDQPNIPTVVLDKLSVTDADNIPIATEETDMVMETDDNSLTTPAIFQNDMQTDGCEDSTHNTAVVSSGSFLDILKKHRKEDGSLSQPSDNQFIIQIKYKNRKFDQYAIGSEGCHLFYGPDEILQYQDEHIKSFGTPTRKPITFPGTNSLTNEKQKKVTQKVLDNVTGGLLLKCVDNKIYALRKSKSNIFVGSASSCPKKLERDREEKIFDFVSFTEWLLKYVKKEVSVHPAADILIGFGQNWKPEENPADNLLVSVSCVNSLALFLLTEFELVKADDQSLPDSSELQISVSNSMDHYCHLLKDLLQLYHA